MRRRAGAGELPENRIGLEHGTPMLTGLSYLDKLNSNFNSKSRKSMIATSLTGRWPSWNFYFSYFYWGSGLSRLY